MAAGWFCSISGREVGPLSSQQVKAMALAGRLAPEDQVRQGANGTWIPAGHVKGLFSSPQPVVKPSPVPIARPAPQPPPVVGPPRGDDLLNIVTEPNTPTARVTGRSSVFPRRKQKQQTIVFLLGGLILLLAVVAIVLVFSPWESKEQAKKQRADTPKEKVQKGDEPDMDAPAETAADPSATDTGASMDAPPGGLVEDNWVDASQLPVPRGDVEVKILSAVIAPVPFSRKLKSIDASRQYLLVTVELRNTSSTRKLNCKGWGGRSLLSRQVKLTDNHKNTYSTPPFGASTVKGQISSASLYPDKTVRDLLVFEPPVETAEFLLLELPAAAFGQQGALRFKIPRKMVGAADLSESTKPPGEGPVRSDERPPVRAVPETEQETVDPEAPSGEAPRQPADTPNAGSDNGEPKQGDINEIRRGIEEIGGGDDAGNEDKEYNFEDILDGGPKPPDKTPAKKKKRKRPRT